MLTLRRSAGFLFLLHLLSVSLLAALSTADLETDLSYYRRSAAEKKLDANDRLYILYRLQQKYQDTHLNLAALEHEIAHWNKIKRRAESPAPAKTEAAGGAVKTVDKGPSSLNQIQLEEDGDTLKIVLKLSRPVVPKALRVDDPQKPGQPVLMLDLPNTENRLSPVTRDMRWGSGPFLSVVTANTDDATVRVRIDMRKDVPYRVVRTGNEIIVEARDESLTALPAIGDGSENTDASYVIQPGDVLNIQISPAKELSRETIVQPDGTVIFPLLGAVTAKDLTANQLEKKLAQDLRPYVAKPNVSVTIKQFSNRNVFMMGKVTRPGPIPYKSELRLLGAISQAGGFTEDADRTAIKIYRGRDAQQKSFTVNAQEILSLGDLSRDFLLEAGDIIEVGRGGNNVFVIGQISKPGNYLYREGYTLLELVSEAGGLGIGAKTKHVKIFRQTLPSRKVVSVNLERIMRGRPEEDVSLKAGDIVLIPQKSIYSGTSAVMTVLSPWIYLATLIVALVIATG